MFRWMSPFILAIVGCATADTKPSSATEMVLAWNQAILEVAEAEDGFLTLKGVRTTAMVHLAMYDAQAEPGAANPVAAANRAAYEIARDQFPDQQARFAALRKRWQPPKLSATAAESSKARGTETARKIINARAGDAWDATAEYQWHPMAPGVYAEFSEHSGTPSGFIFGAGWAAARGFALQRPDQFRVPPPPAIDSADYARAFDEVRQLGRFQSIERTPDQTHIALWWKDFVENSHNRLARSLIRREGLEFRAAARLLARLNMSVFDAYISSFDNKFHYNHWRPFTAIRWADNDGNPRTVAEPLWTNTHRHTYAFPSYPSAHGTACAAAMTILEHAFGDRYAFTMTTPLVDAAGPFSGKVRMHPESRSFASFSEAADQCGASRVYLGIHFRYDATAGVQLGRQVGENVLKRQMGSR